MARELERERQKWIESMIERRGVSGTAELLGIDTASLDIEHASLSDIASIDNAMALLPDPSGSGNSEMWMRPRNHDALPWDPYPDEVEFFGMKIAMSAARWRELRSAAAKIDPERDSELTGLRARARLLELEVTLIRDMGLVLGERSRDSGTLGQNALDREEAWRWRQAELERARYRIEELLRRERKGVRAWLGRKFSRQSGQTPL